MIVKDIDAVVDYLHPLLKKLNIQDSFRGEKDVYAIEIPALDFLNLDNCKITVIRERLPNPTLCGQLLVRYRPEHDLLQFMVYLNEHLFFNEDIPRKNRRIVAVHEFTHIAAHLFAYSADKDKYFSTLEHRLNNTIDDIHKTDVSSLRNYLDEKNYEELDVHRNINHAHFALGPEIMEISYTDLYYNLMFSKKDFKEHFDLKNQKKFFRLWEKNERKEAVKMYRHLVIEAAEKKWVSTRFALDQAFEWLIKYTQNPAGEITDNKSTQQ